jgi:hypothetical protein
MKTHHESVYLIESDLIQARDLNWYTVACITAHEEHKCDDEVEFAPVEAYTKLKTRVDSALEIISRFGGIDGDHHRAWVIDQAVRALTGDGYAEWVRMMNDGENGPNTYEWDQGIAP